MLLNRKLMEPNMWTEEFVWTNKKKTESNRNAEIAEQKNQTVQNQIIEEQNEWIDVCRMKQYTIDAHRMKQYTIVRDCPTNEAWGIEWTNWMKSKGKLLGSSPLK